ncbi:MAG: phenylalanine--tRNA ligase subunit beta [Blastocatellia bacterium]|nr:phenylalanine--tRNA ligase subunit beta [Blastocatellia bacterium]
MKINYNWLKELVDIDLPPRDLAEKLTMAGLAVDAVESYGDEIVLELDLTSNRPDCLSHLGIAREAAAVSGKTARIPGAKLIEAKTRTSDVTSVEILAPELCPRYTARVIRGVKIGPSPDWLVKRIESLGQRSVNNVADITNYVMLEMGQPLHAFDLHQLRGERIIVRMAGNGEKITTLDGEKRDLTPETLVIADAERPVAIAGIKGGEDSGITEKTVDVLLEAAYFAPAQTRATSKALGLSTEASYRFERGTDPEIVAKASDRAAALIAEIAGGEVLGGLVDVYPVKASRDWIEFRHARYTALTGLRIELGEAERVLRSLGGVVEADVENDRLRAMAPSWRIDISIEEDLIEEVARIAGYDKLKNTLPGSAGAGAYLPGEDARRAARLTLTALGYNEAVNFSFVNGETDEMLSEAGADARLALLNPIDETQAHMRTTLLGGLLDSLERNFNQGARNARLFEIGKCFRAGSVERPLETERLGLVATGARNEDDWTSANGGGGGSIDFYDVKGVVESVAEAIGLPALEFEPDGASGFLHPGRGAEARLGDEVIGVVGQLHPRIAARYKFKQPVFVADLNLKMMLLAERTKVRYHPLPKFPTVVRDLALLINTSVQFAGVERAIKELKIPELIGVKLFDLYAGKELPPGKHSIALSLHYRAPDRTLTVEDVNAAHDRVVKMLKREFGAEVR